MAGFPNPLIPYTQVPYTQEYSVIGGFQPSFAKGVDIETMTGMMTNLRQVVMDSFAKLAQFQPGNKLSSQTYGNVGKADFSIVLHEDSSANGYMRTAWNVTAYLTNAVLPVNQKLTESSIDKNINDLKMVVNHLIIIFEKTIKTLTEAPLIKSDPNFKKVESKIRVINATVIDSYKGIHNLLTTYIKDRMLLKENKNDETISKIAFCLEMIFKLKLDSEFDHFCQHKKKNHSPIRNNQEGVYDILSDDQKRIIKENIGPLNTDLLAFFPENEAHIRQLRSIGKLVYRILEINNMIDSKMDVVEKLQLVTHHLKHIDGIDSNTQ